uniref:Putative ran guanine nucleotide release factor n=1 Tax=Populus alba TaxID=43335 RepID=A0A4U5Q8P9_POPAL|nr:putative ran guanine nucleotide release factor [Populus alba]
MPEDISTDRPLFGGAISSTFPVRFQDVSNIRQVPDHQEVFADPSRDESLVFELLDLKPDINDNESAVWFLQDLANEQDAQGFTLVDQSGVVEVPIGDSSALVTTAIGQMGISKGRQGREAQNVVRVYLANLRLKNAGTDVLVVAHEPILISPLSESASAVGPGLLPAAQSGFLPMSEVFKVAVSSFKVNDWSLFGGSESSQGKAKVYMKIIYCLIHASCMPVILIPVVLSGQVVSYDLTSKTYGTTMYCSLCDRFAGDSAIAAVTFEYCIQNLVAVTEDGNQEGKASGSTTGSTTTARQRISHAPSNKLHVHHCSALQFFCLHILFQLEQQVKDLLYIQFRGRERLLCLLSFCTGGAFTYVEGKEDRDMVDALKLILGALPTDVSIEDNCKSAVDHVVREYGRIDILVNNAAAQHYSTTLEAVAEAWLERLFRTNIFGYFFLTK